MALLVLILYNAFVGLYSNFFMHILRSLKFTLEKFVFGGIKYNANVILELGNNKKEIGHRLRFIRLRE